MELLWISIRTVKYEFIRGETAARYCWYLYYLPMLMIPVLYLILAVSMGKPETYRPKRYLLIFPVVSLLLFLLVITNDLHHRTFLIPEGPGGAEVGNYSYGTGYVLIVIQIALCVLASYGIIFIKCRGRGRKKTHFLPLIPLAAAAVLCAFNAAGISVLFGFYHLDITVIFCIATTASLELCIQSGLILTNNGYDELFQKSGLCAVITDRNFSRIISSDGYRDISEENMRKAVRSPIMLENGIRLSSAELKNGYVFWQEDISEMEEIVQKLSETNDYLQGKNSAIQQTCDYQKKKQRLIEKNRLYNRILTDTGSEIELYARLTEELAAESDHSRERLLAVKIAFVSAFIKRHDNLIFLSEEEKPVRAAELYYCVEESLSALHLSGAECCCSFDMTKPLSFEKISRMYENFYRKLFDIIENISSVYVYLIDDEPEAEILMRICLKEDTDLSYMHNETTDAKKEESEWLITIR